MLGNGESRCLSLLKPLVQADCVIPLLRYVLGPPELVLRKNTR